jgi:hypothetical protein
MSDKINLRIELAIKESIAETRVVTVEVDDMAQALEDVSLIDHVTECDYAREDDGSLDVWGVAGADDFRLRLRKA